MKKNILKTSGRMLFLGAGTVLTLTACNPEPDDSDMFTFTGETIDTYLASREDLSDFRSIMARVGYDKMMAAWGSYTCFAPTNEGVRAYCDSLYNDTNARTEHNGMTENSVPGLSDSLCLNIVRFHLSTTLRNAVSLISDKGGEVSTMLGYTFQYVSKGDSTLLNNKAVLIESDHEVVNGIVHVIDNVIPRYDRSFNDMFILNNKEFSIFGEALRVTGWAAKLDVSSKSGISTFKKLPRANDKFGEIWADTLCRVGFTIFAETDSIMRKNGINDFAGLVTYANNVYGGEWKYDYLKENGLTVSTGSDYENPLNALNMFVAYHIVNCAMPQNQMVFEKGSSSYWNYKTDADMHDYYYTMLPHTLLKIWEPGGGNGKKDLFINRYQTFNTLTNEVGTQGSNHDVIRRGLQISRTRSASLEVTNGYIHRIDGMLVYDQVTHENVFHERMRFNCTTLFPELITNQYRYWSSGDGNVPSGYSNSVVGIPNNFFENLVFYDKQVCFVYDLHSRNRCYQSDQLQVWGRFDFAMKLPPVPSGLYEIRIIYPPLSYGGFMQYYIGTSSSIQSMEPLGIPYDYTIPASDPRIGWTRTVGDDKEEDDRGVASDVAMHNRGYMRAPYSFCGHADDIGWTETNNCRNEGGYGMMVIRSVLGRVQLNQGGEHWLRMKTLDPESSTLLSGVDFIEVVPVDVVDNEQYSEDWY